MALNAVSPARDDDQDGARPSGAARNGPGLFAWYAQGFSDPLGDRLLLFDNTSGAPLELLRLRAELSSVPGFETAARERAAALSEFGAARHARVCRVDRLPEPGGGLAVVSEGNQGQRLSEILQLAEQRHLQPGGDIVRRLVNEMVEAVADFHAISPDMAHGALAPQRLVVSPDGQLLVTEYVLGSALARVPLDRAGFWTKLRLALPADTTSPAFDQRTDVVQLGTIALALVLGRPLREDEYPSRLNELVAEAHDRLVLGGWGRLVEPFHAWLRRMLQLDADRPILTAVEARLALADVTAIEQLPAEATAVEAFARTCRRPTAVPAPETPRNVESAEKTQETAPDVEADESDIPDQPFDVIETEPQIDGEEDRMPEVEPPFEFDEEASVPATIPAAAPLTATEIRAALAIPSADQSRPASRTPAPAEHRGSPVAPPWRRYAIIALAVVAIAEGLFISGRFLFNRGSATVSTGAVSIDSVPPQATVVADGKRMGVTPLKLELPPGTHTIEVSSGEVRRTLSVTTSAGSSVVHHVELPQGQQPGPQSGKLRVVTSPAGGRVLVDGKVAGISPVVVPGLAPGKHEVLIETRQGNVRQSVDVEQSETASLVIPLPGAGGPTPGWVTLQSPVEVSVYEDGEMVGTSKSARIMLPAGRHQLQLVAESVGYRATREISVPVGKTVDVDVPMPNGRIDVNALPWAEVLIDNRRVGETPLAGIAVPLGKHVVTFRHPQLGERSVDCLVTLQAPARVSADLRK